MSVSPNVTPGCVLLLCYGHGLCVRATERADAEVDSELVCPSGRWCAGGMSVCTYVRMYVCVYVCPWCGPLGARGELEAPE